MLGLVSRVVLLLLLTGPCILAVCQDQEISRSSNAPLPEYVQEFFLSDAVRSQEKGELQITFGVDSRHGSGTNAFVKSEFGLTDRLQLSAEVPYGKGDEDIPANSPQLEHANGVGLVPDHARSSPVLSDGGCRCGTTARPQPGNRMGAFNHCSAGFRQNAGPCQRKCQHPSRETISRIQFGLGVFN
jgi:hypothetical protein